MAAVNSTKFSCDTLPHLSIGPGVVVAVALQKIDRAPHAEAGAQRHYEGLQNGDSTIEKRHNLVLLKGSGRSVRPARKVVVLLFPHRIFPVSGGLPGLE